MSEAFERMGQRERKTALRLVRQSSAIAAKARISSGSWGVIGAEISLENPRLVEGVELGANSLSF